MSRPFAVFDIDGTLIRWQLYHAVVNVLAKEGLLGDSAYEDIRSARLIWKQRRHPEAFKDYERQVVKVYDRAVRGLSIAEFNRAAERVLDEYKEQTYVYTRDLIKSLKSRGYVLLAISGSTRELVEKLADYYGFDDYAASYYEQVDGHFTGAKVVISKDKGAALEALLTKHDLIREHSIAVGDTASDIALLERVEQPIAFNPDRALFAAAQAQGWKVVVERKNQVYELENHNGTYVLAQTNAG